MRTITGFSKLSKDEKLNFIARECLGDESGGGELLRSFWHPDTESQKVFDEFSENTLTNYYVPYGVVPNFLLNDKLYCVPMVIEESSVVAACAKSAKFWQGRGGFRAEVVSTDKVGQIHFMWKGRSEDLHRLFERVKAQLIEHVSPLTVNMEKRGGGLKDLILKDFTDKEDCYYQLWGTFETCDAMGANFINSVLEGIAARWEEIITSSDELEESSRSVQIVMSILSNYTPDCRVKAWVECPIEDLDDPGLKMDGKYFAEKFCRAVRIAEIDVNRATTHNKGIFNGIDAVILATGNDFRAVEACGHAWACRSGVYRSLTSASMEDGMFKFSIEIPLALGTVGGLTSLHPLARTSLEILGSPGAAELMQIAASVGLAQNFGALRSLVTTGIQQGHMKMHLMNILNHLEADEKEREEAKKYFSDKTVSFQAVRDFISGTRKIQ